MAAVDVGNRIGAVWRIEQAKLIAGLTRVTRDVGTAEELAQEALVAALEQWPTSGIPEKPGAWLMAVAKNRAVDRLRHAKLAERKHAELGREIESAQAFERPDPDAELDDDIGDDLLRLIFVACHPVLSMEARVALTLRLIGGLTTEEIARAFLHPESTIAQRIVRAKRTLAEKKIPFEVPEGADRVDRLAAVVEVIYLIFNEGYSATSGEAWVRPPLCAEALRLGRILGGLTPGEPEVHGLVALMELQASRLAARVGPSGEPILLLDQDRSRWDRLHIRRGLASLERAERLAEQGRPVGPLTVQAALAACHARAQTPADTDWQRIVDLYGLLAELMPSPVVELNRAVAVSMASGPQAGLDLVEKLTEEAALKNYHLLPSVRADLLAKIGRFEEAAVEFRRAAAMTDNGPERDLLNRRAAACAAGEAP